MLRGRCRSRRRELWVWELVPPLPYRGEGRGEGETARSIPIHGEVAPKAPEGLAAELQAVGRLSRCRSRGVAWPNTRPCQGRERRFESGRDRHTPGADGLYGEVAESG